MMICNYMNMDKDILSERLIRTLEPMTSVPMLESLLGRDGHTLQFCINYVVESITTTKWGNFVSLEQDN
jgi:hypothetical protein